MNTRSYAENHGASGVILVPSPQAIENWDSNRHRLLSKGLVTVAAFETNTRARVPAITASLEMLNALFRGEAVSGAEIYRRISKRDPGESFFLNPKRTLSFLVAINSETVFTQNVVASPIRLGEPKTSA